MTFVAFPLRASRRFHQAAGHTGLDTRLLAMLAIMAVIWLAFDIATGGLFLSPRNLFNLALQVSWVGIMAAGMVLVIVSRNISLSVGSILGFIGVFGAMVQVDWLTIGTWQSWVFSCLAMLAAGLVIGAFEGWVIAYLGVPSFVMTLGGLLFFRNAAYQIYEGRTISPLDPTFQLLGGGLEGSIGALWSWVVGIVAGTAIVLLALRTRQKRKRYGFPVRPLALECLLIAAGVGVVLCFVMVMNAYDRPQTDIPSGIPVPVLILGAVAVAMAVLSRRTAFGRYVYAIGGSAESAALAGINVRRTILWIFAIMGLLTAISSIVITARLNAAASATGTLSELNVIAAAVIGGTSLAGGVGTVFGAVLGAVFIQSLDNGMVLIGLPSPLQKMVLAVVLVLAVLIDVLYQRRRR